jgi:putative uncharacterized protein pKP048_01
MSLNQFYTETLFSESLVKSLNSFYPRTVLDLGFGHGSLLYAARKKWPEARLIGVDIDEKNVERANKDRIIEAIHYDGFSSNLFHILKDKYKEIDLLISNPPYFQTDLTEENKNILKAAGLLQCLSKNRKKIPAELVFFAQNLRLLTNKGEMGIILPSGLITGEKWRNFRKHIFQEYTVKNIIQLPVKSFKRTDAQTFIVILSKYINSNKNKKNITVSDILTNTSIELNIEEAIERSDFQFHFYKKNCSASKYKINPQDFIIFRGNVSHACLKKNKRNYFHTTHFSNQESNLNLEVDSWDDVNNTQPGDILLARVGSRCLGKIALVESGSVPISDCIIVVRAKTDNARHHIWSKLFSKKGDEFFKNTCLGVGAKYITHQSLFNFLTT